MLNPLSCTPRQTLSVKGLNRTEIGCIIYFISLFYKSNLTCLLFRSGILRMHKLRSPMLQTQSSQRFLLSKPGIGENIAMHASSAARNFLLPNSYLLDSFNSFFPTSLPTLFLALALANAGSCVGLHNNIGHPAYCHRRLMRVPVSSAREP